MLPLAKVQEIKRLLDEGDLSQRRIAKQLEVSRGVVAAIANGRRGLHGRESTHRDEDLELGPPERCPKCGHLGAHALCLLPGDGVRQSATGAASPARRQRSQSSQPGRQAAALTPPAAGIRITSPDSADADPDRGLQFGGLPLGHVSATRRADNRPSGSPIFFCAAGGRKSIRGHGLKHAGGAGKLLGLPVSARLLKRSAAPTNRSET